MIIYIGETVTNERQNLEEEFPHLITDLTTVCFEAFRKADPDEVLTLLVYEAHRPMIEASNPASVFPFNVVADITQPIKRIINKIVTQHPQRQRIEFTGKHYALIAYYYLDRYLGFNFFR